MAKITIAGNAAVITSELKLEDVKMVAKYRPEALILKGGKDNEETLFRIAVSVCGIGEIGKYGACFDEVSRSEGGAATVTMTIDGIGDKDVKEYIADTYGSAIAKLNAIEEKLPGVVAEITEQKQAVIDSITVA